LRPSCRHPLTLGLAIGLAGCGQKTDTTGGAQVVRIGSVAPLTGPQAHLGKDNENSWAATACRI